MQTYQTIKGTKKGNMVLTSDISKRNMANSFKNKTQLGGCKMRFFGEKNQISCLILVNILVIQNSK